MIGWVQAGQATDNPPRIFEWCSIKDLAHFLQTILIFDIRNSVGLQHLFSAQDCSFPE
jgi:hypothetical protein